MQAILQTESPAPAPAPITSEYGGVIGHDPVSSDPNADAPAPAPAGTNQTNTGSGGSSLSPDPSPGHDISDFGDPATPAPSGGSETALAPIVLDLSGTGIAITPLSSSNLFELIGNDGYQHRTAWAAAGEAVLFYDPNGAGAIVNANQYIFTDWDPSATSDMQALKDVFDTDGNGKLDASDAAYANFKLMVTNPDGTTRVETLADAGIASIDLNTNTVTRVFSDGSSIDGQGALLDRTVTATSADGKLTTIAREWRSWTPPRTVLSGHFAQLKGPRRLRVT